MASLFADGFSMDKWTDIHDPHEDSHQHPTGHMLVERNQHIRTYRMGRENFQHYLDEDERWMKKVELLLRINSYRWHKDGHIAIGDSLEFSCDRKTQTLYVMYEAYDVNPAWACVVSTKSRREEADRLERQRAMDDALGTLKDIVEKREAAALSGQKVH